MTPQDEDRVLEQAPEFVEGRRVADEQIAAGDLGTPLNEVMDELDNVNLYFPHEPSLGHQVRVDCDGDANGNVWVREDVESALPPKATRRWRLVRAPQLDALLPASVSRPPGRYWTWMDVLGQSAAGSRRRCAFEVSER